MHSCWYVHRDIKPGNFVIGLGKTINTIYLIDYGFSKKYKATRTGKHISYRDNKNFTGTVRYASLNTHLGIEQTRRDDIESLGYLLVYFMRGTLPWQGLRSNASANKYECVFKSKVSISVQNLCHDLPGIRCISMISGIRKIDQVFEGAQV